MSVHSKSFTVKIFAVVDASLLYSVLTPNAAHCSQAIATPTLYDVFRAMIVTKNYVLCPSLVWVLLDSGSSASPFFLSRCKRFGLANLPSVDSLFNETDDRPTFFHRVIMFYNLFTATSHNSTYGNLRTRLHDKLY